MNNANNECRGNVAAFMSRDYTDETHTSYESSHKFIQQQDETLKTEIKLAINVALSDYTRLNASCNAALIDDNYRHYVNMYNRLCSNDALNSIVDESINLLNTSHTKDGIDYLQHSIGKILHSLRDVANSIAERHSNNINVINTIESQVTRDALIIMNRDDNIYDIINNILS